MSEKAPDITDDEREALRRIFEEGDFKGVEYFSTRLEAAGLIRIDDEDESECWELTFDGLVEIGEATDPPWPLP